MSHKNIKLLSWFNFCVDFIPYAPIAIIYFAQITGSYALGMSIFSVIFLSAALSEVPTGIFSDFIGRKKTMTFGALANICAATFFAIGGSYALLVAGAIFAGLARSFFSGNNDAFLYETLLENKEENSFDKHFGKTTAMFEKALAVSAILGSILAFWSLSLVLWVSVIPHIFAFFISFYFIEPKVHTKRSSNVFMHLKQSLKQTWGNKKLRLITITSMIRFGLGESVYRFRSAFINTLWPLWAVGIAYMLSNVAAAGGLSLSSTIMKRIGAVKTFVLEIVANRVINIFAVLFPTLLSPVLLAFTSLFWGFGEVAENTILQREFTKEQRATLGSVTSFCGSIFFAVFAVILGELGDVLGAAKTILLVQILFFSTFWFYWKFFQEEKSTIKKI